MIEFNEEILDFEKTCNELRELKKEGKNFSVLYAHINKFNKKIYIRTNKFSASR